MRRLNARLGLGLEDDSVPVPEVDMDESFAQIDDNFETVDLAEDNVSMAETQLDTMVQTKEGLEAIVVALENFGLARLDPNLNAMVNISVENAVAVVTGGRTEEESSEKIEEKKEGLLKKIEALGKAIMAFVRKIIDAISGFFSRLFSTASSMKKTATALMERAKKAKDRGAGKIKFNANELQIADKVIEASEAVKVSEDLVVKAKTILLGSDSLVGSNLQKQIKAAIEKIGAKVPDDATFDSHGDKKTGYISITDGQDLSKLVLEHVSNLAKDLGITKKATDNERKKLTDKEDVEVFISEKPLPGNFYTYMILPSKGANIGDKTGWFSYAFNDFIKSIKLGVYRDSETAKVERTEVDALSITDIATILGNIILTCDDVIKYKDTWFKEFKAIGQYDFMATKRKEMQLGLANIIRGDTSRFPFVLTKEEHEKLQNMPKDQLIKYFIKHGIKAVNALHDVNISVLTYINRRSGFETMASNSILRSSHALLGYCRASVDFHTTEQAAA